MRRKISFRFSHPGRFLSYCVIASAILLACDKSSVSTNGKLPNPDGSTTVNNSSPGNTNNPSSGTTGEATQPQVSLTANGKSESVVVEENTNVHLVWNSLNATACNLTMAVGTTGSALSQSWGTTLSGAHDLIPTDQTAFVAHCTDANGQKASSTVVIYVAPPCLAKTVIQLLTPSVTNNALNQFVKYSLSYTDCNGKPLPFPNGNLWYDNDGKIQASAASESLPFQITAGSTSVSGQLDPVVGEDLFGHTGPIYLHYLSSQSLSLPSGLSSFTLSINVSGKTVHSYDTDWENPPAEESIRTFLRFADAEPDVVSVIFKNLK